MLVMKFGGTSVEDATAIDRAAGIVKGRVSQKPAVVVSAMARVTDQLLATARAAGAGDRETALKLQDAWAARDWERPGSCWGRLFLLNFTANSNPNSILSMNSCGALLPSVS